CEEAPLAARLAGLPAVLGTFHVLPSVDVEGRYSKPVHRRLERRSCSALDLAISVSDAAKRDWVARVRLHPETVLTIRNGIDPDHFRRRSPPETARRELGVPLDGSTLLGAVGRLEPVKGLDCLIEALALLRAGGHPVRVL